MLMITLYAEQKKRHRFIEQSFRLFGRRRGRDVSREQHRKMYTIKGETDYRPRLDAWDKCSDLVLWEDLEGAGGEGGGRGDRMGKTCEPKAFSFQCMTKFTTNKKKREREKKKKNYSKYFGTEKGHQHRAVWTKNSQHRRGKKRVSGRNSLRESYRSIDYFLVRRN